MQLASSSSFTDLVVVPLVNVSVDVDCGLLLVVGSNRE